MNHWAAGMNGGKPEFSGNNKETGKGTNNYTHIKVIWKMWSLWEHIKCFQHGIYSQLRNQSVIQYMTQKSVNKDVKKQQQMFRVIAGVQACFTVLCVPGFLLADVT